MILKRTIEKSLIKLTREYPVVTITGPRQSGKTTLCRKVFPNIPYFNFEKPDIRRRVLSDPNGFLKGLKTPVILDEIQRTPDFFSYIQAHVDESGKTNQFILTGSSQFQIHERISQSLAGRTALLTLLPFSFEEIYPQRNVLQNLDRVLYTGFYPGIHSHKLNPTEALGYYCSTYVERDVRSLLNVKDMSTFEIFLKLCAGRTAQIMNYQSIGNDCGISHNTVKSWISVLQASYLVLLVRPHFQNFKKRLVKSSKIHFLDSGLLCYLLDILDFHQIQNHPLRGYIFESMIVSELLKQRTNRNLKINFYYWRDNTGHEIDLIMDFGNTVLPIEIKSAKTVTGDFFKNLNFYRSLNPKSQTAVLIYGGDESFFENNTWIISYRDLHVFKELDHRLKIKI